MTTPQEEAERRWPSGDVYTGTHRGPVIAQNARSCFVAGAEWMAGELGLTVEQVQRLGPLVEAARAHILGSVGSGDDGVAWCFECWSRWEEEHDEDCTADALRRALAALDEEGGD